MRILLAEDDSVLADGLTRSLRQSGYVTDCVNNGQEADSALSTQDFDLLILDLDLPRMPGLEVLRRIRADVMGVIVKRKFEDDDFAALDLAGIPLHAADRDESHPVVIAGGHAAFNPEPIAEFVDAAVLGDGEEIAGLLIKLTSPGSVFFRQMRCGLNGRHFTLLKFRTRSAGGSPSRR